MENFNDWIVNSGTHIYKVQNTMQVTTKITFYSPSQKNK